MKREKLVSVSYKNAKQFTLLKQQLRNSTKILNSLTDKNLMRSQA